MLGRLNSFIDRCIELAVAFIFMCVALTGGLQVFFRFILNSPLAWSEELQIYGHIWIVFLTIPIAYNRGSHIMMTILLDRMPGRMRRAMAVAVDLAWLWLGVSIVVYTMRLVGVAAYQRSPSLEIPMSYVYAGMIAGGAYLVLVAVRKLAGHWRGGAPAAQGGGAAP